MQVPLNCYVCFFSIIVDTTLREVDSYATFLSNLYLICTAKSGIVALLNSQLDVVEMLITVTALYLKLSVWVRA